MANILGKDKQIAVFAALAEGNSIRSIERMTGMTPAMAAGIERDFWSWEDLFEAAS